MQTRAFGRTGRRVGEIGFGAWAIGGSWGAVDDRDAVAALNAALYTCTETAVRNGGDRCGAAPTTAGERQFNACKQLVYGPIVIPERKLGECWMSCVGSAGFRGDLQVAPPTGGPALRILRQTRNGLHAPQHREV